ncbi:hypothetical protein P879_03067 [Paragonimus westermani]|uniref:MARVEL domain-containing protein n=1 Tax=Paragonimus westermani TaxID=34504 RepID=A0A8T0DQK8_9TREM|nr:hypothetical protein P879_03067 [Paragonimus westermani]
MDRVPQTYETTYETRTVEPESSAVVNVAFVKSLGGILKLCEIIISCIVLICVASTNTWSYYSTGGWVNFVAAFTLILAGLFYIFYLFHLIRRLRGPWVIIEFSFLIISTFIWFIAFIVSAASNKYGSGAIAAAVFSLAAFGVYVAELVTRFRVARQANGFRITMTGVTTTTATPGGYPHMAPSTTPTVSAPVHNPNETRIGFHGTYPSDTQPQHSDEGYVMP